MYVANTSTKEPEDFVIATGEMYTVRAFCTAAFKEVGLELEWRGEGVNEKDIIRPQAKL